MGLQDLQSTHDSKGLGSGCPLAGSEIERPSAAFAQILSVFHLGGTGAFSGCPRASRFCCSKGRAGLDCVKNKMNQRWAKLSGGDDRTEVLQSVPERSLHLLSRTLIMVTLLDSSEFLKFVEQNGNRQHHHCLQTRRTTSFSGEWNEGVRERPQGQAV